MVLRRGQVSLGEWNQRGVQVRLAEGLDFAVGLDVAATDRLVEGDRVGPLLGRAVAQFAPLPVGVVWARYCESEVTIALGGCLPALHLSEAEPLPPARRVIA